MALKPEIDKSIEQRVGARLIDAPAEHVAAEHDGRDLETRPAEFPLLHGNLRLWL